MAQRVRSQYELTPVPEAIECILEHSRVLQQERVRFQEALGRVLAGDVCASDSLPPFPASIKDGYAVCAADGAGTFPICGEVRAGGAAVSVQPGQVAYITTGAPVPNGADAVIQIEDTERVPGAQEVTILKAATSGQDIRTVGSDIEKGQLCLPAGTLIGPAEVGILATVGATQVPVVRTPLVATMSTGDEVVEPACTELGPGQIRDSNRSMLVAAVVEAGCRVLDLGIVRDQEGDLDGVLQRALDGGADVIITSGGVSMGDRDLVKPLLERSGRVHFGRVLMKPGKPLTFATINVSDTRRVLFVGLPGNPVSSIVCFHLFVRAALRKLAGQETPGLRRVNAVLAAGLKLDPERPEYHRVRLSWREPTSEHPCGCFVAESTGGQRSSRLLSVRSAFGLLELPQGGEGRAGVAAGEAVPCIVMGDLRDMPLCAEDV